MFVSSTSECGKKQINSFVNLRSFSINKIPNVGYAADSVLALALDNEHGAEVVINMTLKEFVNITKAVQDKVWEEVS